MLSAIHQRLTHEMVHSFLVASHILPLDISNSTKLDMCSESLRQ